MEFISLEDHKPFLGQYVLLYNDNNKHHQKEHYNNYSTGVLINNGGVLKWNTKAANIQNYHAYTHWMPLHPPVKSLSPEEKLERFKNALSKVIPGEIVQVDLCELIDEAAIVNAINEHSDKINCNVEVLEYLRPMMYYTMVAK